MTTNEWISVQERLPQFEVPVFALDERRRIVFRVRDEDGDGWFWCNPYNSIYHDGAGWKATDAEYDDNYTVTHWMPLPEAPADCDSEATSLEPGAPERDAKKGSGSTPDAERKLSEALGFTPGEHDATILMLNAVVRIRRLTSERSTPDETLREALERTLANFKSALAGRVIRDAAETIAEAERALATPTKPARTAQPEDFHHEPGEPFPTKPEMQPEGLVSSCQALSETAGESARKSESAPFEEQLKRAYYYREDGTWWGFDELDDPDTEWARGHAVALVARRLAEKKPRHVYCNPPYSNIRPWIEKAWLRAERRDPAQPGGKEKT